MTVLANPPDSLTFQGYYDTFTKRRGPLRTTETMVIGNTLGWAQSRVIDPLGSHGVGATREVACMRLHVVLTNHPTGTACCLGRVTTKDAPPHGPVGPWPALGCPRLSDGHRRGLPNPGPSLSARIAAQSPPTAA